MNCAKYLQECFELTDALHVTQRDCAPRTAGVVCISPRRPIRTSS